MSIAAGHRLERRDNPADLLEIADAWNGLAEMAGSPFLTAQWLAAWWRAFGTGDIACFALRDRGGELRAAACCAEDGGRLVGMANEHSGDWDGLARDDADREDLWAAIASLGHGAVVLPVMANAATREAAAGALRGAGYVVSVTPVLDSPFLALPASWEDLSGGLSRQHRNQLGRKRRRLEREGRLVFRTTSGERDLDADLRSFFAVEGSGWKSREGTAILSSPRTRAFYTDMAERFARQGWLRIHLLELDGTVIAADLGCTFAGGSFLMKTGFDERFAELSPGFVLQGETLRASIEEGSRSYDFLGGPDPYKMRWCSELHQRVTLRAFRGWRRSLGVYYSTLRPPLRAAVRRARELRSDTVGGR
jgi:CelD/BcsL family acetyltransferase involved in cellulose biosynthesis